MKGNSGEVRKGVSAYYIPGNWQGGKGQSKLNAIST